MRDEAREEIRKSEQDHSRTKKKCPPLVEIAETELGESIFPSEKVFAFLHKPFDSTDERDESIKLLIGPRSRTAL